MTPEQEIKGLKNLCASWREDCRHYKAAIGAIRELVEPYANESGILSAIKCFCTDALEHNILCETCGDSDCQNPLACETGDGE